METVTEEQHRASVLNEASLISLIEKKGALPHLYEGTPIESGKAAAILLSDDILLTQRFCTDNPELCDSQDLWQALFQLKFPELYLPFLEVSFAFTSEGKTGIIAGMAASHRKPLFWRDCYLDLQNMPYPMTRHVETLINGDIICESDDASFWGSHMYLEVTLVALFESFWTVGVVLANLDTTRDIVAPALLMIPEGHKLMPCVLFAHEIFCSETLLVLMSERRVLSVALREATGMPQTLNMKEKALLYLIENHFPLDPGDVLCYAARKGYTDTVRLLLNPQPRIPRAESKICSGSPKECTTASWGNPCSQCAGKGLDIKPQTLWLQRAMTLASAGGHSGVLKLLLDHQGAEPSAKNNEALLVASKGGHADAVRLLLADSRFIPPSPKGEGDRDFIGAVEGGNPEVVLLLLNSAGVDFSSSYEKAMRSAVGLGHSRVVQILLDYAVERGFVVSLGKWRNVQWFHHPEVVSVLLGDGGIDPAAENNRAVCTASRLGLAKVVQLLLADPRVDPAFGDNRAIFFASREGRPEVVRLLIADPRVDPAAGSNAAIWAALEGVELHRNGERKKEYEDVIVLLADVPVLNSKRDRCVSYVPFGDYQRLSRSILKKIVRRREGALALIDARMGKLELIRRLNKSQHKR